jgi:hypothetical protein
LSVAHQIYNRFKKAGKSLNSADVAILDAAEYHHYQVSLSRAEKSAELEYAYSFVAWMVSMHQAPRSDKM